VTSSESPWRRIDAVAGRLRAASRDWRLRLWFPVLLIHLVVFVGLYLLSYRVAMRQVLSTYELSSEPVLVEIREELQSEGIGHDIKVLRNRLRRESRPRGIELSVYGPRGELLASTGNVIDSAEMGHVRSTIAAAERGQAAVETSWRLFRHGGDHISGVLPLENNAGCRSCHGPEYGVLGAVQMRAEIVPILAGARRQLKVGIGLLMAAWALLAMFMAYIRRVVIGRPLEQMAASIGRASRGSHKDPSRDLGTLASDVNRALWDLLDRERSRRSGINRQLRRAEQLAALGSVAAGISHEIRNPIAGVRTAIEVLRTEDDRVEPDGRDLYDRILSELDRINRTVGNLLRLARPPKACRMPGQLEEIALHAVDLVRPQLARQGIALKLNVAGPIPKLDLDSDMMMQMIINLVRNSAQAIRKDGKVNVVVSGFPDEGGAILTVEDDGPGIPEGALDQVFEPFFTTKETGTGLGLPICRQIAELHGGTVTLESRRDRGTRIVVLLPKETPTAEAGAGE